MSDTEWVAVDWGTSNVRAWGIAADGGVTFATESDRGMGRIAPADYPGVLDGLLAGQTAGDGPLDVVICGMAGARQGWLEAPYVETPADLRTLGQRAARPRDAAARLSPRILPGVCQRSRDEGEDVMRGEETQLLGLLRLRPGFDGTVVLPGTHSKWVDIRDGRIERFSTAMTGELYDLLGAHSVLRHTVADPQPGDSAEAGRAEGLTTGLDKPELLTSRLFRARAAALLSGKDAGWCAGYLSGLLIGAEVAGHAGWLGGNPVPLIGSPRLSGIYATALKMAGHDSEPVAAADATIAGLTEARAS